MQKLFQALGVLGLLAWTATGLWAWSAVGDGVQLIVRQGDSTESETTALLGDRISALSADLDALITSLDSNFAMLGEALASQASADAADSATTRASLAELREMLPELLARLDALALALAQASALSQAAASEPIAELPTEVVLDEPAAEVVREAEVVEEPVARSFLAFRLPSRDFRFDGEQTFEVLGDLSRVGFDAKSTLHDFSGVSNGVSGSLRVDLAHPEAGLSGSIAIPSASLVTGVEGRDEAMLEHLDSEHNERIEFTPESFVTVRSDSQKRELEGRVKGRMTIRGVSREATMDVRAHVDESRRLVLEGEMALRLSDYSVPVPNKLGMISMDDEVRVWIHLRARAQSGSSVR